MERKYENQEIKLFKQLTLVVLVSIGLIFGQRMLNFIY